MVQFVRYYLVVTISSHCSTISKITFRQAFGKISSVIIIEKQRHCADANPSRTAYPERQWRDVEHPIDS
jgi:DNA-binding cell septation regulator SpoVG